MILIVIYVYIYNITEYILSYILYNLNSIMLANYI